MQTGCHALQAQSKVKSLTARVTELQAEKDKVTCNRAELLRLAQKSTMLTVQAPHANNIVVPAAGPFTALLACVCRGTGGNRQKPTTKCIIAKPVSCQTGCRGQLPWSNVTLI